MAKSFHSTLLFSVFAFALHLRAQTPAAYAYLLITTDIELRVSVNGGSEYAAPTGDAITRIPLERGDNIVRIKPADGGKDGYTEIVRVEQPENKALLINLGEKRRIAAQSAEARQAILDKQNEEKQKLEAPFKSIDVAMVLVEGGTFTMGCTKKDYWHYCSSDERPIRKVTLSNYYIAKYEVTQKQWRAVMGSNPSKFKDCENENCPVENVSWEEVQEFLEKLNAANPGKHYRLPTEAEWEYAARGGKKSKKYQFAGGKKIDDVAWYVSNSGRQTHPIGLKKANELGLYDLSGNVAEWCSDHYGEYPFRDQTNPAGPSEGKYHVARGGSYELSDSGCRVEARSSVMSNGLYSNWAYTVGVKYTSDIGLRLACSL